MPELLEDAVLMEYKRFLHLYHIENRQPREQEKRKKALARAAAVVMTLGQYIIDHGADWKSYTPYREALEWIKQHQEDYWPEGCRDIPTHEITLKKAVMAVFVGAKGFGKEPIEQVIKLPRVNNSNRDRFKSDPEILAWAFQARKSGQNWTDRHVSRYVNEVCELYGKKAPSGSWWSKFFSRPDVKQLTALGRYGAGTKKANFYQHYKPIQRAMFAGDCWMMDGTRVNMIEHRADSSGKKEFQFLYILVVRDVYSGDILGVHFDTREDHLGYINALKIAVKSTGYLPHTLVFDRFPGHNKEAFGYQEGGKLLTGLCKKLDEKGVELVVTSQAQGKASLERWFDTLQTVFLAQSRYYYGQGIMSSRSFAHRSPEYLAEARKQAQRTGWDFDQAWQEAWKRIEEYRNTPLSHYSRKHAKLDLTPAQLHQQSEKPHVIEADPLVQTSLFWLEKTLKIQRNAIRMTVDHQEYTYSIYDHRLTGTYKEVLVRFDQTDMSSILLFAPNQSTDFFITELKQDKPVVLYGPDADLEGLAKRQAKEKRFEQAKKQELETIIAGAPDVTVLLGAKVPKYEQESAQSVLLYEQMGVLRATKQAVVGTNYPTAAPPKKGRSLPLATDDDLDPNLHVSY
ncbi:hypothetical protein [Larkinella sp. VNQ87]|uniref:hypothetical protein n=1 Tax=Larkinella sp. VNQ87 TaxID=3400921 RepID=UPI003C2ADE62